VEDRLFNSDPSQYLPHCPPFLFVDKVISREPGVSATAEIVVTSGSGPFPPILLIESMAQVGGIAAGQVAGAGGVLAAVSQGLIPAAVGPGKYLVSARIVKSFGTLHMVEGEVLGEGISIASAILTLAVGSPG